MSSKHVQSDLGETSQTSAIPGSRGTEEAQDVIETFEDSEEIASYNYTIGNSFTENTHIRARIGAVQVASLVINQSIASSIFGSPGQVLSKCGSKRLSIAIFVLMGFYNMLSGIMFLEYSTAYPFVGGPLIWLDEIFYKPPMLATIIFAWYWTLFATTGNVTGVAQYLLIIANHDSVSGITEGETRVVSVFVLTVVCLLLYFTRRLSFMLMTAFALLKVAFLLVLFISGMVVTFRDRSNNGLSDLTVSYPSATGFEQLSPFLLVSLSYAGWEHTNYIAGEIKNSARELKRGVLIGISLVWVLYTLVVIAFYITLSYDEIVHSPIGSSIGYTFAEKVFGSTKGFSVMLALSNFSSALALTYTFSKVRQAIAWQRIQPFYKFVGRQDRQFDSPGGALLEHWIFTVLQIAATNLYGATSSLWAYVYTYGYQIELGILAVGLFWMRKRISKNRIGWKFQMIPNTIALSILVMILAGFNLLVLIVTSLSTLTGVSDYWMAVTLGGVAVLATIHCMMLHLLSRRSTDGTGRTIGEKYLGFEVLIHNINDNEQEMSDHYKVLMREARAEGSRRRLEYKLHGRTRKTVEIVKGWITVLGSWLE